MASELAKVRSLYLTEEALRSKIVAMLRDEPLAASFLLAAVKLDEDVEKGLVPPELGRIEETSRRFGALFSKQTLSSVSVEFDVVDLPPFLKQALIGLLASSVSGEKTENLK